jgi:hypothetical protein
MPVSSPRLDARLRRAAVELDDGEQPIAETWRHVSALAENIGCTRPGYDTIRLIVHEHRRRREEIRELLRPVVADVVRGRVSPWDVERVIEAATLARDPETPS